MNRQRKVLITTTYNELGIIIDTKAEEVAQQDLQPTCNQLATDCISRQMAIEAFEPTHYKDWYTPTIIETLETLPSVRPEVLACGNGELVKESDGLVNDLVKDCIDRQAAIDAIDEIESEIAEGFGFEYEKWRKYFCDLPPAQPERTCVNCGRTANNGGWYADGRTRCPIEEHYALPKDGYCHLWEKRNVTDDDYPERREE